MRYRLMASYRGVPYEAGVGPSGGDVVLFAACPPPEELGFEPATGHWRKRVIRAEIDALWEYRPVGVYCGEPCLVLDDLGDRLHITYLGTDSARAARLGYWQVDRGVFELLTKREDVTGLTEERVDNALWAAPSPAPSPPAPSPPAPSPPAPPPGGPVDAVHGLSGYSLADDTVSSLYAVSADTAAIVAGPPPAGRSPASAANGRATADAVTRFMPRLDTAPAAQDAGADTPAHSAGIGKDELEAKSVTGPDLLAPGPPGDANPVPPAPADGTPANGSYLAGPGFRDRTFPGAPTPLDESRPPAEACTAAKPAGAPPSGPNGLPHPAVPSAAAPPPSPDQLTTPAPGQAPATPPPATPPPATPPPATPPPATPPPATHPHTGHHSGYRAGRNASSPRRSARDSGRRAARRTRVTTRDIFSELTDVAAIPRAAYALEAEVDGALCLMSSGEGFEVFVAAEGARHEVRTFADEEAAYFYLFGVLAAEAIRNGTLAPARPGGAD